MSRRAASPGQARGGDERGAVAVLVAVLATLLMVVSALAVDLGNAWARERDVQTQADVAALSAASLLPAGTAAQRQLVATEVADYLNRVDNHVAGQPLVTAEQLLDDRAVNGSVVLTDAGTTLRVLAPRAEVRLTFAQLLGYGPIPVSAEATVRVFSALPRVEDVVPFWLPSGCPLGPVDADTTNGGSSTGCTGSARGRFGQLASPRASAPQPDAATYALNLAEGLDHALLPFRDAPSGDCERPTAIGQWDSVSREGNTCVIGDPGDDGPATYAGLVTGVGDSPGRLDASRGATRPGCNGGDVVVDGLLLNNDLLSCFLTGPGATLGSLTAATGVTTPLLDPSVVESPRFVWIPVVHATDRAAQGYQPLRTFVPGFVTDESAASSSTVPAYTDTTRDNGVRVAGRSVRALQVFTFSPDAVPVDERAATTPYDGALGRRLPRLVG